MPDWAIVAIIAVVVLFGASKLPDIARNLGRSSGEFKKGLREGHDESKDGADAPATSSEAAPAAPSEPPAAPSEPPAAPTTTETTPPDPRSENPA